MNKLITLPETVLDKLKAKALKAKARSVKSYIESLLIEHVKK